MINFARLFLALFLFFAIFSIVSGGNAFLTAEMIELAIAAAAAIVVDWAKREGGR